MFIHPWDAATGPAEWQDWLATTGRFGILAVNNLDPARAPLVLPPAMTARASGTAAVPPWRWRCRQAAP